MVARMRLRLTCIVSIVASAAMEHRDRWVCIVEHVWKIVYICSPPSPPLLSVFEHLCLYESLAELGNFISCCQAAAVCRRVSNMFTAAFTYVCFVCMGMKGCRLKCG